MEENKNKKKIAGKELAWYIIAGTIALIGLVFIIFGVIGAHYPGKASDNWVAVSEAAWLSNWSYMGYRWWGLILLGVGALLGVICLNLFARSGDRDEERAIRRQQRISLERQAEAEAQPEVVPVESKEVEPKAEEQKEEPQPEPVEEKVEEAQPEPAEEKAEEAQPEPVEEKAEEPAPEQPEESAPEAKPEE